jgi:multiple sugar transport system ATP-binding protein
MAAVTLQGVRKVYDGGVVAVHGVDLEVADGEFVVLVGPSGCGKSTTLRMIAGLESLSGGHIEIGGRVVDELAPAARDVAMVFQSYALYPHMTVRENLGFALRLRRRPKDEIERRVLEAARVLGLDTMLDRRPAQLSGGQRQRVAIGRALVREPRVFLFDEPLSNLDAKLRGEMRREIAALRRRLGATMVYVTHDQVEAMTLGDRIVVMHEGRVRQIDTPAGVYERPHDTFVAGFLGSPPMNLIPGTLARDEALGSVAFRDDTGGIVPLAPAVTDAATRAGATKVILGVRPEHLRIEPAPEGSTDVARPRATVELVEPLGHEQLAHLSGPTGALTARLDPSVRVAMGEWVYLRPDPARVHLFDAASGLALRGA